MYWPGHQLGSTAIHPVASAYLDLFRRPHSTERQPDCVFGVSINAVLAVAVARAELPDDSEGENYD